jgi:hypothetical protein
MPPKAIGMVINNLDWSIFTEHSKQSRNKIDEAGGTRQNIRTNIRPNASLIPIIRHQHDRPIGEGLQTWRAEARRCKPKKGISRRGAASHNNNNTPLTPSHNAED